MVTGVVKTRQELAGEVDSPFALGQQPKDTDFANFMFSALFPREDTAARIAVDETTKTLWQAQFADLPADEQGRLLLQGLLNRLLTWVNERLQLPAFVAVTPAPIYLTSTTFAVDADVTETIVPGQRIRASNGGLPVYGTVTASVWDGNVTTVTLDMDEAEVLTSALDGADISLFDLRVIPKLSITADELAAGAIEAKLGYTPANRAGDTVDEDDEPVPTFTGPVTATNFRAAGGEVYGKLTVTDTSPPPDEGEDGDIWLVYEP